jgi:uncharacterized integral membrane protein (TIGR00698 family)
LLIALFSCAAFYISDLSFVKSLSFSPLIVGIILGMLYANSLRNRLPETWVPGILFCSKQILRLGIILYGFKLTFQDVMAVGLPAILIDIIVVTVTICGGVLIGKWMKMETQTANTSKGLTFDNVPDGAAAILGAESTIKSKPYQTAVAISTVVIFGTISMFLYPVLYRNGIVDLTPDQMGIYTGSTLHEVAHVVGAGNAMGKEISDVGIIVKMIRVIMLVPALLVIGYFVARASVQKINQHQPAEGGKSKITIPWFALGFLAVIGFNSFDLLPQPAISFINDFDTFLLTMAMTALGAETSIEKFKKAGVKPFLLASFLYIWLLAGGYLLVRYITPYFV